ncbi:predicted protein [Uncinocarpus reesii 1704]|uniref:Uncharacterized protein n=1 Tax=Uncinocarpus reesii (strain UAMH 1704) TaxID=336963 RepID=C4JTS3_UNCRE|nr:uncharacterized protein UREG_05862 [Uncinocarpus reesii 1704]EEP81020.1 predicted protein [Uncinocarpus reesii 1704]
MASQKPSPPDYYSKLPDCESLLGKLCNLDNSSDFRKCKYQLGNEETCNFVVDFDDNGAWGAFDVDKAELSALLDKTKPRPFETRWIHYGMSHRLGGLMCSDPSRKKKITPLSPKLACDKPNGVVDETEVSSETTKSSDIEAGYQSEKMVPADAPRSLEKQEFDMGGISFSQLVDKIWHFSTSSSSVAQLIELGTVISIQENPFAQENLTREQRQAALKIIRRNIGLVLFGISKQHGENKKKNPLLGTHIRNSSSESTDVRVKKGEGPSLLFYYIFDDWATNYSLVIGREHSYSAALEKLRTNMLERPRVNLITDLHRVGRELAVLKRLYQSYELIATRILNRQWQMKEQTRSVSQRTASQIRGLNKHRFNVTRDHTWTSLPDDESEDEFNPRQSGGVQLKAAALNRVERLADRIRLYALSEIEECLNEKETLTFLVSSGFFPQKRRTI